MNEKKEIQKDFKPDSVLKSTKEFMCPKCNRYKRHERDCKKCTNYVQLMDLFEEKKK